LEKLRQQPGARRAGRSPEATENRYSYWLAIQIRRERSGTAQLSVSRACEQLAADLKRHFPAEREQISHKRLSSIFRSVSDLRKSDSAIETHLDGLLKELRLAKAKAGKDAKVLPLRLTGQGPEVIANLILSNPNKI
jgi:hypothetical protein